MWWSSASTGAEPPSDSSHLDSRGQSISVSSSQPALVWQPRLAGPALRDLRTIQSLWQLESDRLRGTSSESAGLEPVVAPGAQQNESPGDFQLSRVDHRQHITTPAQQSLLSDLGVVRGKQLKVQ